MVLTVGERGEGWCGSGGCDGLQTLSESLGNSSALPLAEVPLLVKRIVA
jgi:hypothetical protein